MSQFADSFDPFGDSMIGSMGEQVTIGNETIDAIVDDFLESGKAIPGGKSQDVETIIYVSQDDYRRLGIAKGTTITRKGKKTRVLRLRDDDDSLVTLYCSINNNAPSF
jgi:hypothetical protein